MNIVYFCTSEFGNPNNSAIIETLTKEHAIKAVVTTPDSKVGRKQVLTESPISQYAHKLGLPILKPERVKNNQEFLNQLRALEPDLFIVVAYGKILPKELLEIPKYQPINLHPSLLPKYRGPSPIPFALLNGETETGTSIMLMDEEMDHGPILAQEKVSVDNDDTFLTLSEKLNQISAPLLVKTIDGFINGTIKPLEQDHGKATYSKIFSKDDGKIDWQKPAQEIYNQYRALIPWPGVWTTWNNQMLKIIDCGLGNRKTDAPAGTVLDGGQVVCGNGSTIQVKRLQLAGKSETDTKSFLNGYKNFIGSTLN